MFMCRALLALGVVVMSMTNAHGKEVDIQPSTEWIRLVNLSDNVELVVKKPVIKGEFTAQIHAESLLLMLDGVDVTPLAVVTLQGFSYRAPMVLPSGGHNLVISATGANGIPLQKSISFSTRHTELFDDAAMNNDLTVIYEGVVGQHSAPAMQPTTRLESNFSSMTHLKNKEFLFSFATNLRYLEQNTSVMAPLRKGVNLANWLMTLGYTKDRLSLLGNLGDVQVNETAYTAYNLARRGLVVTAGYDQLQLRFFDVLSEQVFGFRGGVGTGFETGDHISGVSCGVKMFDNHMEAKAIYVNGGESGSSFNISTPTTKRRGTVYGFLLNSDFFANSARTELEAAFSTYNPDLSGDVGSKGSQAYRGKVAGMVNIFNYEAQLERIGADFVTIGNLAGLQKDKEGVSFRTGLNPAPHNFSLNYSRYNDNVKEDSLMARIVNHQAGLEYSNSWLPNFPFGVVYQKSRQDSVDAPVGSTPLSLDTDMITGRIGIIEGALSVNLMTAYSRQKDRTAAHNSTTNTTYTFNPMYTLANISINTNLQYNRAVYFTTSDTANTWTANMDLRSNWFGQRLNCDLAGTYTVMYNDLSTIDTRNLQANARIAYQFRNLFGFVSSSLGLRGTYTHFDDQLNPTVGREEYSLFGMFTAAVPFSL